MRKSLQELQPGDNLGVSAWVEVGQQRIDQFAEATGDFQWIHVDQKRCETQSPFGQTIAHGLLSTSLMPAIFYDLITLDEQSQTLLNYGIDSLRYLEPVRSGDNIRYHVEVADRQQKSTGTLFKFSCTVEIQDRDKPAMVGTFLMLLVAK